MKFYIVAHIITGVCLTYVMWVSTSGLPRPQYYEDPTLFYKPMKLEAKLGGGFNITICVEELMTCWELVRGETWCQSSYRFDTFCPLMKEFCHDYFWNYPPVLQRLQFRMFEIECPYWEDDYST